VTDTLPRSHHWQGEPTLCNLCGKFINFGDRFSNVDAISNGKKVSLLCHESCADDEQKEACVICGLPCTIFDPDSGEPVHPGECYERLQEDRYDAMCQRREQAIDSFSFD